MEELLSMPTESALPPRFHHHQPPLLLALVLMEMESLPEPVSRLELSRPFAEAEPLPHHQPLLERAEELMETESSPEPVSMSEFSTAVDCVVPPQALALM